MRIRTTAATAALLLAALTACGGGDSSDDAATDTKPAPAASSSVDCTSQTVSQADWVKYCAGKAGGQSPEAGSTDLKFGESYTWPDGLKVSVTGAKVFTDYAADYAETAEPGQTDFRVELKVTNTGKAPADLGDLSVIVEGATNGGEAAATMFQNGSQPLEGRLAPGVTATKNNDNQLETKYGKRVVVTVQRASDDFSLEFPEFTGEITG
jgi:hypothetical protein